MKKIVTLFIVLIISVSAVLTVSADSAYVVDNAGLLTESEISSLETKISSVREKYSFDIVFLTVTSLEGKPVSAFADDYYDQNGYGQGENKDGLLFMLSMEGGEGNRDYYTSTCGSGITVFTDYGIDKIGEVILPYLKDGDYYGAFDIYLDVADEFLAEAQNGTVFDYGNTYKEPVTASDYAVGCAIAVVIAIVLAFIYVSVLKGKMKNTARQPYAREYVKKDSFVLSRESDIFLYSTQTRTAIPRERSGSSTHVSSGGVSHGGGGGKF